MQTELLFGIACVDWTKEYTECGKFLSQSQYKDSATIKFLLFRVKKSIHGIIYMVYTEKGKPKLTAHEAWRPTV